MLNTQVEPLPRREEWSGMAGRRAQEVLLSCYCREIASPQGAVRLRPRSVLSYGPRGDAGGYLLEVDLPHTKARVVVAVEAPSATGNYVYCSPVWYQLHHRGWEVADWRSLSQLLLRELEERFGTGPQQELAHQVADSVAVMTAILARRAGGRDSAGPYVESEQGLVFGHSFHPAPKSRLGFSAEDVRRFSPETRTRYPLHFFAVRPESVIQASVMEREATDIFREDLGSAAEALGGDFLPIPVHPWQAGHLLSHPLVKRALQEDRLRYLGPLGPEFFPTSSLRTMYAPQLPFFYKCSLHVRVTNCLRKNAVYELEGSLFATRALRVLEKDLATHFPWLRMLEEPAFATVGLDGEGEAARRDLEERFAVILRESLPRTVDDRTRVARVAASLFGTDGFTRGRLMAVVAESAPHLGYERAVEGWFHGYAERLLPPVLYAFFHHGIVHEAHLQNTLLVTERGAPEGLLLRDLEGLKVVPERFAALALDTLTPEARRAISYGDEQGWKRIAYCLFVNNLSETVAALAGGSERLERRLWDRVRQVLTGYERRFGTEESARRIGPLLAGAPFPGKANLTVRFLKKADREAGYVLVPNPLGRVPEVPSWN
ncbi:MAG TPA: IucA/IucC family protein [Archangium sp.]|uniref:IucA/IucC family protein n=1 Tax=Archangium sp. TaxID=1872627 RepID=UPI002E31B335|nr:IucA/IucC family protein [Archangium sp.]HEX5746332.1 IucA/IucC family protein [Archangium sp.]